MDFLDDLINFLDIIAAGKDPRQEVVGTDTVGEYTIDTCFTLDCGYETGIRKGEGSWIIVQRYRDREQAEKGHAIWMAMCEAKPVKAWSVQTKNYEEF